MSLVAGSRQAITRSTTGATSFVAIFSGFPTHSVWTRYIQLECVRKNCNLFCWKVVRLTGQLPFTTEYKKLSTHHMNLLLSLAAIFPCTVTGNTRRKIRTVAWQVGCLRQTNHTLCSNLQDTPYLKYFSTPFVLILVVWTICRFKLVNKYTKTCIYVYTIYKKRELLIIGNEGCREDTWISCDRKAK
jgi:hypothetical protein